MDGSKARKIPQMRDSLERTCSSATIALRGPVQNSAGDDSQQSGICSDPLQSEVSKACDAIKTDPTDLKTAFLAPTVHCRPKCETSSKVAEFFAYCNQPLIPKQRIERLG